jgi:hypothetical protein
MSILNHFRDSRKTIGEVITSSRSSCSAIDAENMCGGGGVLQIGRGSSYNEVGARSSAEAAASSTFCDNITSITTQSHDVAKR